MSAQLALRLKTTWGGRRTGAGRPRLPRRAGVAHRARPAHKARTRCTSRCGPGPGFLRCDDGPRLRVIRDCIAASSSGAVSRRALFRAARPRAHAGRGQRGTSPLVRGSGAGDSQRPTAQPSSWSRWAGVGRSVPHAGNEDAHRGSSRAGLRVDEHQEAQPGSLRRASIPALRRRGSMASWPLARGHRLRTRRPCDRPLPGWAPGDGGGVG